ncbi:MAG: ATP-dependent Clp protease proteolytic subunit [Sulfolobaceae archaeon]
METVYGIKDKEIAILLHSPGGQIEAVQSIVEYLRKKFDRVIAIIPDAAMSAATLFALASDGIIMGKHSNLGPIDPQFVINMPYGQISISAQSLLH